MKKTKRKIFRLLPTTILTAFLLICVKVVGMIRDTETLLISQVEAQQAEKPSNVSTEKPKTADQDKSAKKPEEKKTEGGEHKSEEKKEGKDNPNVTKEIDSTADHRYTDVEVELLQSLSKRREELDRWETNIQIKEAALDATQKRVDAKIAQIESMKKQVASLLEKYNTQEDAKIKSLVKIYENMKPAEAARIFDEVEMPILLLVIDAMSEKKAAPILAAMNPKRAKQLTVELANERKINSKVTSGATDTASEQPQDNSSTPAITPNSATATPTPSSTPANTQETGNKPSK